ncbi:MAG: DUF4363 family protein [Clostridia bacterium]|nr:DUF4363 family protein [Clostridia bacterium]
MKRVWIALVLIILCTGFCLVSFFTITNDCKSLISQTREIEKLAQQEEFEQIVQAAEHIQSEWNEDAFSFSLLTTHIHYDTLEECTDKLYHACMQKDTKEIKRACDDLIFEANHIIESIRPKARNVF